MQEMRNLSTRPSIACMIIQKELLHLIFVIDNWIEINIIYHSRFNLPFPICIIQLTISSQAVLIIILSMSLSNHDIRHVLCDSIQFNFLTQMDKFNSIMLVVGLDVCYLIFDGQLKSFQLHLSNQLRTLSHVIVNCTAVNDSGYVNVHPKKVLN